MLVMMSHPFADERPPRESTGLCERCDRPFKYKDLGRVGIAVNGGPLKWGPWSCDSCWSGLKPVPIWEDPIV